MIFVKDLTKCFADFCCKPKRDWNIYVREFASDRAISCWPAGSTCYARPGVLNLPVVRWWIERETIVILAEADDETFEKIRRLEP